MAIGKIHYVVIKKSKWKVYLFYIHYIVLYCKKKNADYVS